MFGPNAPLTREQLALILYHYAQPEMDAESLNFWTAILPWWGTYSATWA